MYMLYLWNESDFMRYLYKKLSTFKIKQKFRVREKILPNHWGLYFTSSFASKVNTDTQISSTADNLTISVERKYMPVCSIYD